MREEKREKEGGPTEGTRVGWMEVGVIEEEEGPPTGHKKGASPAACGCHHQPREEEEKPSAHMSSLWANASRCGAGEMVHNAMAKLQGVAV